MTRSLISHTLLATLALSMLAPVSGCGMFRRTRMTSNVQSSVNISNGDRDLATLEREEYEVLETGVGQANAKRWFILWFPVGNHDTKAELEENAAFDAVARVKDCDEVILRHTKSKRIVIPLLLVNVVVNRLTLRGRCIAVKGDDELAAQGAGIPIAIVEEPAMPEPPPPPPPPVIAPADPTSGPPSGVTR
jgi:hypothetical protein